MSKKETVKKEVAETVVTATKTKNISELLSKDATKGEKLSGIVRLFGEADDLRTDTKRQTMLNRVSKVGTALTAMSDDKVMADEKLVAVGKLAAANMGLIKTNATDKESEIPEELKSAYLTLLSYGKKVKFQDIDEDFEF